MERKGKPESLLCGDVEELLIRGSFESLNKQDKKGVAEHVALCGHCRNQMELIENMQISFKQKPEPDIIPDPAILQDLLRRRKKDISLQVPVIQWLSNLISEFFTSRQLAYNAGMVAVIFMLGFFLGYRYKTKWGAEEVRVAVQAIEQDSTKQEDSLKNSNLAGSVKNNNVLEPYESNLIKQVNTVESP